VDLSFLIFFDNAESSQSLTSDDGNEVTIEFLGHTLALVAGVPPTNRKRKKLAKEEKRKVHQSMINEAKRRKKLKKAETKKKISESKK
jgi:hypothetical protein